MTPSPPMLTKRKVLMWLRALQQLAIGEPFQADLRRVVHLVAGEHGSEPTLDAMVEQDFHRLGSSASSPA